MASEAHTMQTRIEVDELLRVHRVSTWGWPDSPQTNDPDYVGGVYGAVQALVYLSQHHPSRPITLVVHVNGWTARLLEVWEGLARAFGVAVQSYVLYVPAAVDYAALVQMQGSLPAALQNRLCYWYANRPSSCPDAVLRDHFCLAVSVLRDNEVGVVESRDWHRFRHVLELRRG